MREAGAPRDLGRAVVVAAVVAIQAAVLASCAPSAGSATPDPAAASPSVAAPSASPAGAGPPSSPEIGAMATPTPQPTALTLTSPAFADGSPIPTEFTCRGRDVSPALAWRGVPPEAAALVLLVDDPDGRDWVHWTVLDLPATDGELPRAVAPTADPPQQGRNDFGRIGYGGPCPPSGTHRYRFTLYALAAPLALPGHPAGGAVRAALRGATIRATVTLTGTFRA